MRRAQISPHPAWQASAALWLRWQLHGHLPTGRRQRRSAPTAPILLATQDDEGMDLVHLLGSELAGERDHALVLVFAAQHDVGELRMRGGLDEAQVLRA